MDPPAWTSAEEFQYRRQDETNRASSSQHHDEELPVSQRRMSQPEAPVASNAAVQQGAVNDRDDDNNAKGDPLTGPDYKDQVRRAGNDRVAQQPAVEQQADSIIPLAESVYIVVEEEEPPNPPTLPALALPVAPSGINAKNTVGTVERPAVAKPAASMAQLNNSVNGNNSLPTETPPIAPNTSNVSEDMLKEVSEDEEKPEEGPTTTPPPVPPNSLSNPNSLATDSLQAPPKAAANRQPGTHRKHKIWAKSLILGVVVVAVIAVVAVVLIQKGGGTKSPNEEMESPTEEIKLPMTVQTEQAKLTASDGAANDYFSRSVAINGDTIVIGADDDDTENGSRSGSAYVYTLSGSVWTEQAKLTASDGATYDNFGYSVAINGDTIVIGAYYDDTEHGSDSGSAYVYTLSGSVWTEQAKLTASDGAAGDRFGRSVAINGDTLVIGAYSDDTENGSRSGSAHVYTLSGSVWTEQAKLTSSDGAANDEFGWSVAINGGTIVIGAELDDTENGSYSGSAYVYTLSGSVWTEQAKLTASDGAAYDYFGWSVAINGGTIVIGAELDDTENGSYSGSAYVYTLSGSAWTEQAKLTASDGAASDYFGISVAINGGTIVIGADEDDTENGIDSGSAYVYTLSGTVWTEQAKLTASDGAADDEFGSSVAVDGGTIVIGAYQDDTENGSNSGSAYLFFIE